MQAVFCIDVRSEVYRRSLESESNEIETLGFAGFFGLAIQYFPFYKESGTALCPVLLVPGTKVKQGLKAENSSLETKLLGSYRFKEILQEAWNSFKTSAISCFSFVESVGIGFLLPLFSKSFPTAFLKSDPDSNKSQDAKKLKTFGDQDSDLALNIQASLPERVDMAAGALKNMGLTDHFARLVLFCGHGSESVNNPYASSLDCGACGGHSGEINARILAQILNQTEVRQGLKRLGIEIPEETFFLAGLHNTTTDEVKIFETGIHSLTFELLEDKVKEWLNRASYKSRIRRAEIVGSTDNMQNVSEKKFHDKVFLNSYDWSQTRPEWGLAGNAAFIAAPRNRTLLIDLGGRSFLHNYTADRDLDESILELIMVAPMIVASWINLQYYGSTVNNNLYGSGNKVLHNVVGKLGVWQGNGGDLQSGLPMQSLHDGKKWIHDPLRLSVFLEAPKAAIDRVINKHPDVKNLILNQWLYVFSIEPGTNHIYKKTSQSHWDEV